MSDSAHTDHGHSHGAGDHGHGHGLAHVMPLPILIGVFLALIFFTIVTVAVTAIDLGKLNIWIAMGIATIKALLVAIFFMHLRYDKPLSSILFFGSFIFVFLFLGVVLIDRHAYEADMNAFIRSETAKTAPAANAVVVPLGPGAEGAPAAAPGTTGAPAAPAAAPKH
jgi:cytochrome c oxidase subunit 4